MNNPIHPSPERVQEKIINVSFTKKFPAFTKKIPTFTKKTLNFPDWLGLQPSHKYEIQIKKFKKILINIFLSQTDTIYLQHHIFLFLFYLFHRNQRKDGK